MRTLAPLAALLAVACASTPPVAAPRAAPPPPPPPPAPVALAPPPQPPAPEATPALDPCAEGALRDLLAELPAGHALADPSVGGYTRPRERRAALGALFPAVRREGFRVLAVAKVDALPGGALAALVAPNDATLERDRQVSDPQLALLSCQTGAGWTLASRPHALFSESLPQLLTVEPTPLPGGAQGATVTVFSYFATGESNATAYLLGAASPALPVLRQPTAAAGVLGVVGTTGERVVAEGTGDYRVLAPLDATGWYPLGDARAFVRVARERSPDERGRWGEAGQGAVLARLDAQGLSERSQDDAVWLLAGPGAMPSWCAGRADLRCAPLTLEGAALPGASMRYAWVAGAWAVGSPVPRAVRAPGARWFLAGSWDGERPPRDPSGHAPLTTLPITATPAHR